MSVSMFVNIKLNSPEIFTTMFNTMECTYWHSIPVVYRYMDFTRGGTEKGAANFKEQLINKDKEEGSDEVFLLVKAFWGRNWLDGGTIFLCVHGR